MYKDKKIAVIGVNGDPGKYGFKIFNSLLEARFDVFAVGIRGGTAAGHTIYKTLKDLPAKPDVIVTVVPPVGTDKVVGDAIALGIKEVWMQPGSRSPEAVEKAKAAGMKVTDYGCFMVANGIW
ncbi:MAG: CoA-binding protein [Endomicrobium sp.]|jgi:predicted CoA-binding protein|nr:CoA-binding protein [Endomicrobium sp.]